MTVVKLWRRITGQPDPVPPGIGQAIQAREQAEAKLRLLQSNRMREYRWHGR